MWGEVRLGEVRWSEWVWLILGWFGIKSHQASNRTSLRAPATESRSIASLRSSSVLSLLSSSAPQTSPLSTVEPPSSRPAPALAVRELDSESPVPLVFLFSSSPALLPLPLPPSTTQEDEGGDSPDPVTAPRANSESLSSFSSSRRAATGGRPEAVAVGLEADEATWALRRFR